MQYYSKELKGHERRNYNKYNKMTDIPKYTCPTCGKALTEREMLSHTCKIETIKCKRCGFNINLYEMRKSAWICPYCGASLEGQGFKPKF